MKPLTDDEWVAEARKRVAEGEGWQTPESELAAPAPSVALAELETAVTLACPYCIDRPALIVFERPGATATVALWYCSQCYGFWAPAGSIDDGDTGLYVDSPALDAVQGPKRCRACFGHLRLDGTCMQCGRVLPAMDCPAGHGAMERFEKDGVTLDSCKQCHGVWFDIGEISAVYHLSPAQGLAMERAAPFTNGGEFPPHWLRAFALVVRLFAPIIGM